MTALDFQIAYITKRLAIGETYRFGAYNFLGLKSSTGTVLVGGNGSRAETPWDIHQDAWSPDKPLGDVTITNPSTALAAIDVNFITSTVRLSWNPAGVIAQSVSIDQATVTVPTSDAATVNLDADIGAKADTSATTDTGTFSLIALFKRLLSKIATQLPAALGQTTKSGSMPVTLASDQGNVSVAVASALPTGANVVGKMTIDSSTTGTTDKVTIGGAAAALADGSATPTTCKIGANNLLYNGTNWDLQRGNIAANTGDTGAKTTTGNGATQTNQNARGAILLFNLGTVTGTTPTCVFKIQGSNDAGTTWYDVPGAATASLTATGQTVLTIYPGATVAANAAVSYPLPRTWRVVWTIGGTTPSFTITNIQVSYIL